MDKLNKIQNQALRLSIGVRISTPINSLMAETGVTPLKLRFDELSNRYAIKILSLTSSTPAKALDRLINLMSNKRRCPAYDNSFPLLKAYKKFDQFRNLIHSHRLPIPYQFPYEIRWHKPDIDLVSGRELQGLTPEDTSNNFSTMSNQKFGNYTHFFTDGSKSPQDDQKVGIGVYCPQLNLEISLTISNHASIFTLKGTGIIKAIDLTSIYNIEKAVIFTDSLSVLQAINNLDLDKNSYSTNNPTKTKKRR